MRRGDLPAVVLAMTALGVACQTPSPEGSPFDAGRTVGEADGGPPMDGGPVDPRTHLACAPLQGPGCAPASGFAERLSEFCCLNKSAQTFRWWRAENATTGPRFIAHRMPEGGPFKYYDAPLSELAGGLPPAFEDPAVTRSFIEAEVRVVPSAAPGGERMVLGGEGMRSATIPLRYGVLSSDGFIEAFTCPGSPDFLSAGPGPTPDSVSLLFRSTGLCVPECDTDHDTRLALFDVDLTTGKVIGPRCLLSGTGAYGIFHPHQRLFAAITQDYTRPNEPVRIARLDPAGTATVTHVLPSTMHTLEFWPSRDDRVVYNLPSTATAPSAWKSVSLLQNGGYTETSAEFDPYLDELEDLVSGAGGTAYAIGRPRPAIADPALWWVVVRIGSDGAIDHALVPRTQLFMEPQVVEWGGAAYVVMPVLPEGGTYDDAGNLRPNVIVYRALEWLQDPQ